MAKIVYELPAPAIPCNREICMGLTQAEPPKSDLLTGIYESGEPEDRLEQLRRLR